MRVSATCAALAAALLAKGAAAQGLASIDAQIAAGGVAVQRIGEGLYVLYLEAGGNPVVSIGEQGVLLVDDNFTDSVPIYQAKIRELGGGDVDLVVNTHWHYDHTDGNQVLGPQGAWIVSQANSRDMMTRANVINVVVRPSVDQSAYTTVALPVATFDDAMQLHFNGERIDLLHFGPAHTTGDAAVVFRGHNVVHLGDVFNTSGFPFIDADNGGDIDGVIRFCEAVLAEIDEDTVIVPGHGRIGTYADLRDYVRMLQTVRDRIAALLARNATLQEVLEAKTTAEWEAALGDPTRLVDRVYASLSR